MSEFISPLVIASSGLVVGLIVRLTALVRQERRAWGDGRSTLSRADRREIRRAIREGRPVADHALAAPAVQLGEEIRSSIARMPSWRSNPPHWVFVFGRIFFPLLGTFGLVSGIAGHDPASILSGIVLLAFTGLYLPVTERWTSTRRAERRRRMHGSIDANRLLS